MYYSTVYFSSVHKGHCTTVSCSSKLMVIILLIQVVHLLCLLENLLNLQIWKCFCNAKHWQWIHFAWWRSPKFLHFINTKQRHYIRNQVYKYIYFSKSWRKKKRHCTKHLGLPPAITYMFFFTLLNTRYYLELKL